MISLATGSKKSRGVEQALGDVSILTSRTMEQIVAARPDELRRCEEIGRDPMAGACGGEPIDGGSGLGTLDEAVRSMRGGGGMIRGGRVDEVDENGFPVYDPVAYSF